MSPLPLLRSAALTLLWLALGPTRAPAQVAADSTLVAPAGGAAPAAPALPDATTRSWQVGVLRPDRLQHLSLSFTVGLSFGLMSQRPEVAAVGGMSLGLAKELYDARHTRFDAIDLLADAIGVAAAVVATAAIED